MTISTMEFLDEDTHDQSCPVCYGEGTLEVELSDVGLNGYATVFCEACDAGQILQDRAEQDAFTAWDRTQD